MWYVLYINDMDDTPFTQGGLSIYRGAGHENLWGGGI